MTMFYCVVNVDKCSGIYCNYFFILIAEDEHGAWDKDKDKADGGLSYECRTLLFKAIHNLIER